MAMLFDSKIGHNEDGDVVVTVSMYAEDALEIAMALFRATETHLATIQEKIANGEGSVEQMIRCHDFMVTEYGMWQQLANMAYAQAEQDREA